jgi:hypothetical protein
MRDAGVALGSHRRDGGEGAALMTDAGVAPGWDDAVMGRVGDEGLWTGDWEARGRAEEAFHSTLRAMRSGDQAAVEATIAFLEADPWAFRSGYAKNKAMLALAQVQLSGEHRTRLARVVLHHVDVGDRLEFRASCRLARRVGTTRLRDPLVGRLASGDRGRARRAVLMLAALRGPRLDRRSLEAVRRLVLELAPDRTFTGERAEVVRLLVGSSRHNDRRLLRTLAVRFWSIDWEAQLLTMAVGDEPDRTRAIRVLQALPRLHTPVHDERLAAAIKRARLLDPR